MFPVIDRMGARFSEKWLFFQSKFLLHITIFKTGLTFLKPDFKQSDLFSEGLRPQSTKFQCYFSDFFADFEYFLKTIR